MSDVRVTALSITPVKATRLHTVAEVELGAAGARGDRELFIVDERDKMVNAKTVGPLLTVSADLLDGHLRLTLPDGSLVEDEVGLGAALSVRFYSGHREARVVEGPFSEALSAVAGRPLRLVSGGAAVDRGRRGGVTLISRASLSRLAREGGEPAVDARRFRMLVEVDGIAANEEDAWVGQTVEVGETRVRFHGHVGRCLITSRDPETGTVDLPTLDILGAYRRELPTTEPLPFGIYGEVLAPGRVRLGDQVRVL